MKGWRGQLALWRRELEFGLHVQGCWDHLLGAKAPGGASWGRASAAVVAFLLLVVLVSGGLLSLGYAPSTSSAHQSVSYMMGPGGVSAGGMVRSLHHHGTSLLLLALVFHGLRVAVSCAHRAPRQLLWVSGVLAGLLVLLFALTGSLLPWDQAAYYGTLVRLGIAEGVPLVGPLSARLLRGGDVLGNLTLTRFHGLHVVVLPVCLALLLGYHLFLRTRLGLGRASMSRRDVSYWPDQALRNMVVVSVLGVGLLALAFLLPASLGDIANPSRSFVAEPAWYDYWLFELVHGAEPIQWLGSVVAPSLILGFVLLFPWFDTRGRGLRERRGLLTLLLLFGLVVSLSAKCAWDLRTDRLARSAAGESEAEAPPLPPSDTISADTLRAAMLFGQHCSECHGSRGEAIDEDATDMRTEDFARMAEADFGHLVDAVLNGGEMMEALGDKLSEEEARLILREVVLRFPAMAVSED